ncbi:MAG TPA: diacylglycerol kinase family protein [Chloroflexota bacterium]|nr:diacylglycerol kinase family protein [Chloroflexota bacterium]
MTKTAPVRMAKRVKRLARLAAKVEHVEAGQAREIVRLQAAARIRELLPPDHDQTPVSPGPSLPALLIINSKSGPNHDSLLRVRELVDLLAVRGIAAEVRVKLHKSQARREARAAARAGYPLVLAAGGDGTVAAVARGLIGSQTVLGIIPLGTYNNVATSLGIPVDLNAACALIAAAPVRAIDVGEAQARGMKRPRVFLEFGAVGVAAPLATAGQGFEKGRWDAVTRHLPQAIDMSPTMLGIRLDGQRSAYRSRSMLAIVANTPRAGAGLVVAPLAKVDDGLFDVRVYDEMSQPTLATHFLAVKVGTVGEDPRVHSSSGRKLLIKSATPLPVVVDSKVVGSTPVRFRVRTGGLLVIAGHGDALSRPAAQSLVTAIKDHSDSPWSLEDNGHAPETAAATLSTSRSVGMQLARRGRPLGIALATGLAFALVPGLSRWFNRRRR